MSNPKVVVTASCASGQVAISGGVYMDMTASFLVMSMPGTDSPPHSWKSQVTLAGGGSLPAGTVITATAYVYCQ